MKAAAAGFSGVRGLKEGVVEEGSRGTVGNPGGGGGGDGKLTSGIKHACGKEGGAHTCLQLTGHGGRGSTDRQAGQRIVQAGGKSRRSGRRGHPRELDLKGRERERHEGSEVKGQLGGGRRQKT